MEPYKYIKLRPASYEEFCENFKLDIPERFNFAFDFIDTMAAADPSRLAMIHVNDDEEAAYYDFAFFSRESSRWANVLKDAGIKKGDAVMMILYRRVEFWLAMLALHKIGAIAIPSPSMLTPKDIDYRVQSADVKGIIAADESVKAVEESRKICNPGVLFHVGDGKKYDGWLPVQELADKASPQFAKPADFMGGEDPMVIYFSSGTSSMPKLVQHNHNYPFGHIMTAVYWHNLEEGDIHLTLADTGWAKSSWGKFYGQWLAGAVVFVYDFRGKFDADALLRMIAAYKVNSFCAPPTAYRFMVLEDLKKYDLSNLRYCTTAGELLNESVFKDWKARTGLKIHEAYGQTETVVQIATFSFMEPKPGSIGRPCPGWDLVLLDADGEECPTGDEGEIAVRIDENRPIGLFNGYTGDLEKTAAAMHDGYYFTGDKAWVDEDGYFWFVGRVDDLIKSSGYRIGPFEVESVLVSHDAVIEAAVTGMPDPVRGQLVKATVVLAKGYTPSPELTKILQDYVKNATAPYKYPRVIEYVDELPKTISGKIRRVEIRERDNKKMQS